jgi:hypothetical protein
LIRKTTSRSPACNGQRQWLGAGYRLSWCREGRVAARPFAVGGSVSRRTAPWFRIHHPELRLEQALPLSVAIAFTRSNGASHKNLRGWTRHSSLVTRHCPSQFVLGIDRRFVIEGKAAVTGGRRGDTVGYLFYATSYRVVGSSGLVSLQ